jgi:hypothetical protein
MKIIKIISVLLYILCINTHSIVAKDFNKQITVDDIYNMIKKYGPKSTVNQLSKRDWHNWFTIEKNISDGDSEWIKLASYLYPGIDAGTSIGLIIALANALPKNPIAVLKLEDANISLKRVCSFPFIEPDNEFIKNYSESVIQALNSIDDEKVQIEAQVCKLRLNATFNLISKGKNDSH